MNTVRRVAFPLFLLAALMVSHSFAVDLVPTHISYQGLIELEGTPYSGEARFKFALVDTISGDYAWSNDGVHGGEPEASVYLVINNGVFSVLLGQEPMAPIYPDIAGHFTTGQALRIWVDLGEGFVRLGDQPLSSVPFAHSAYSAVTSPGSFSAAGTIYSSAGGFRFPDGTVQTTAAVGGGGGGNTLDGAYDQGGPGAGRTITADAGAVSITGGGGLVVSDDIHIGTGSANGEVFISQVGSTDAAKMLTFGKTTSPTFFFESGFAQASAAGTALKLKSIWMPTTQPLMSFMGDGKIGLGMTAPLAPVHLRAGNNWNLSTTNGDFLIGDSSYQFKIGMATSGIGAGDVYLRSVGGTNQMVLGAGANNVMWVKETGIEVRQGPFQINSVGQVNLTGDFGVGQAGTGLKVENSNAGGIALWAKTSGSDASAVVQNMGTGDILRGFQGTVLKFRVLNSGKVVTPSIQITGGADLTETFDVSKTDFLVEPGAVLVIDENSPGRLTLSSNAYDTRVAGVVSGAGGVNPGLTLAQEGVLEGSEKVALSGRVYVRATADNGSIRPGDMLTTSSRQGLAMRVTDRERAFGAVLGKAMTSLDAGEGLVLALIGLQ